MIVFINKRNKRHGIETSELNAISMAVAYDVSDSKETSEIVLHLNDGSIIVLKAGIEEYQKIKSLKCDQNYIIHVEWSYFNYTEPKTSIKLSRFFND